MQCRWSDLLAQIAQVVIVDVVVRRAKRQVAAVRRYVSTPWRTSPLFQPTLPVSGVKLDAADVGLGWDGGHRVVASTRAPDLDCRVGSHEPNSKHAQTRSLCPSTPFQSVIWHVPTVPRWSSDPEAKVVGSVAEVSTDHVRFSCS